MDWITVLISVGSFFIFTSFILFFLHRQHIQQITRQEGLLKKIEEMNRMQYLPAPVQVDLEPVHKHLRELPNKVLQSIQGRINTSKGALGELIAYLELRGKYDRIIPLGNIVDFICIRFPKDEDEGAMDLIDIKTGSASRLSKDQLMLKTLIDENKVNFIKYDVSDHKINN